MLMTHIPNLICVMGYSLGDIYQRKMAQVTWNTSFATNSLGITMLIAYHRNGAALLSKSSRDLAAAKPGQARPDPASPSLTDAFSG